MSKLAAIISVALLMLSAVACAQDDPGTAPDRAVETTQEGTGNGEADAAPDFSFETFEGETFTLAEQSGTPVVLNFWESW